MENLSKAIKGENVMSLELDKMFTSMLNNQVPANWTKVGFLSLKPLSAWMEEFIKRVAFF
jgi:dynein heavy chain